MENSKITLLFLSCCHETVTLVCYYDIMNNKSPNINTLTTLKPFTQEELINALKHVGLWAVSSKEYYNSATRYEEKPGGTHPKDAFELRSLAHYGLPSRLPGHLTVREEYTFHAAKGATVADITADSITGQDMPVTLISPNIHILTEHTKALAHNPHIAVMSSSIYLYSDDFLFADKADQLPMRIKQWRDGTGAYVMQSAGNSGKLGEIPFKSDISTNDWFKSESLRNQITYPQQPHALVNHYPKLSLFVQAAVEQPDGSWSIDGVSQGSGHVLTGEVERDAEFAGKRRVMKNGKPLVVNNQYVKEDAPVPFRFTSHATPRVAGELAALDHRFGPAFSGKDDDSYLPRRYGLFAGIVTARPHERVQRRMGFSRNVPGGPISYELRNDAGHRFHPEYGKQFDVHTAGHLMAYMTAMAQTDPDLIQDWYSPAPIRKDFRGTPPERDADGLYRYTVTLPDNAQGLKLTTEFDFAEHATMDRQVNVKAGDTTIPLSTSIQLITERQQPNSEDWHITEFSDYAINTTHHLVGQPVKTLEYISKQPIDRLMVTFDGFKPNDIVSRLGAQQIAYIRNLPPIDLKGALPLGELRQLSPEQLAAHKQMFLSRLQEVQKNYLSLDALETLVKTGEMQPEAVRQTKNFLRSWHQGFGNTRYEPAIGDELKAIDVKALQDFQRHKGLSVTGEINESTLTAMRSEAPMIRATQALDSPFRAEKGSTQHYDTPSVTTPPLGNGETPKAREL